jgi:hypothetical protein
VTTGFEPIVLKDLAIAVAKGDDPQNDNQWSDVYRFPKGSLPVGPIVLELEIAGVHPSLRPKDLLSRLVRVGGDETKRKAHPVGSVKRWSDVVTYVEYINETDLPMTFQMWQNSPNGLFIVEKLIWKPFSVGEYIAGRISTAV